MDQKLRRNNDIIATAIATIIDTNLWSNPSNIHTIEPIYLQDSSVLVSEKVTGKCDNILVQSVREVHSSKIIIRYTSSVIIEQDNTVRGIFSHSRIFHHGATDSIIYRYNYCISGKIGEDVVLTELDSVFSSVLLDIFNKVVLNNITETDDVIGPNFILLATQSKLKYLKEIPTNERTIITNSN